MHFSRLADAVIRVYDAAGNVIESQEPAASSKSGERNGVKTKSRHAVKRDGSL
jgi:hypothetical protein